MLTSFRIYDYSGHFDFVFPFLNFHSTDTSRSPPLAPHLPSFTSQILSTFERLVISSAKFHVFRREF